MFDWTGKKVLITGATGFIGSWLTEELINKGATVSVLIKKDDPLGTDAIKHLIDSTTQIYGDIRDKEVIEKSVKDQEFIFHLAAVTQVIYAKNNPVEAFEVDAGGTFNILEAMRKSDTNQFLVYASTDKVYGEPVYVPIDENHPLLGKSPYDASKIAADRLVYAYKMTYGLNTGIVRWSNTIGGRDANFLRAAPDFITSILNNKNPVIRGNGKHIRDYMYITDAVDGILKIAENSNISNGEAFNIGTEKPTSVLELANKIIKLIGQEGKMEPIILGKPTVGEIDVQYLACKKAKQKLGWEPKVNLEESLLKTIQWYSENLWWQQVIERVKSFYDIKIS